jgi:hypothetical protein
MNIIEDRLAPSGIIFSSIVPALRWKPSYKEEVLQMASGMLSSALLHIVKQRDKLNHI